MQLAARAFDRAVEGFEGPHRRPVDALVGDRDLRLLLDDLKVVQVSEQRLQSLELAKVRAERQPPGVLRELEGVPKLLRGEPRGVQRQRGIERAGRRQRFLKLARPFADAGCEMARGPRQPRAAVERLAQLANGLFQLREMDPIERIRQLLPAAFARGFALPDDRGHCRAWPTLATGIFREQFQRDVHLSYAPERRGDAAQIAPGGPDMGAGAAFDGGDGFTEPA